MIVCRVASKEDVPALVVFALESHQELGEVPDVVFVCEDTEDDRFLATVGLTIRNGMPVMLGAILPPDVYEDVELRRAVAEDLRKFSWGWLEEHGCSAFVCSVSRRNTRMQRWLERHGGRCYTKSNGQRWYVVVINPALVEEKVA